MIDLDAFIDALDRRDREIVVLLVEEEAAAAGVADPARPGAAPVVARALRETCERLEVELEGERERERRGDLDDEDDDDWDRPAVPYAAADIAAAAEAAVVASPALDMALGRYVSRLPWRRRRGLLRRARRTWERAGVRDPDALEGRDIVRRAILDEALGDGFEPPAAVVVERAAQAPAVAEPLSALAARIAPDDSDVAAACARLGADAVRETLDQATFLRARGGLPASVRPRWLRDAIAARAAALG